MSDTRFLRSAQFGGYERADVEERFAFLAEQVYSLKNELREIKKLFSALEDGAGTEEAFQRVTEGERSRLSKTQAKYDEAKEKLAVAADDIVAKDAEIAALKEQLLAVQETLREKTEKLIGYEVSGAAALSAVFIEAQKSADLLVNTAKHDAEELETNSRKLADNTVKEANNTAKKIVHEAELHAAQMLAQAENERAELETAANNVRASFLSDAERLSKEAEALRSAFDAFRNNGFAALDQSCDMLTAACESAKAGGVPEFRMPETAEPKLPAEPALEPVDDDYVFTTAEQAEEKRQRNAELDRLMAMAESIADGEEPAAAEEQTEEPEQSEQPAAQAKPEQSGGQAPDLAALSALAASLDVGDKPAEEAPAAKKQEQPAPKAPAVLDLAALAAQAAALEDN